MSWDPRGAGPCQTVLPSDPVFFCHDTSPLADPGGGGAPRPWPHPNAKLARSNYVLASPKPASGFA